MVKVFWESALSRMSLENEDPIPAYEISGIAKMQSKILYAREFLLSFSELEICKKLPTGFDPSILNEFEDAFHGVQERQRAPVGSQFQSYKRNDYSSSPPTRGDLGSYSRSSYGRWDTRSSGRSDRDSDSHSDKDSDPGRNPSRRPWQSSEHDGLLGSGSFSRPGYGSGNPLLKSKVADDYQQNRINGPYQPPRPYKAAPFARRETKDSFNDETFGSSEGASEDKVEEERQRRASFELMRKEQHQVLQGKQKFNEKQMITTGAGISEFMDHSKEEKSDLKGSDVLHESATAAIPVNDSIKSSTLSQTTTSRPLIPPGFANAFGEKNSGVKPSVHIHKIEIAKSKLEELPLTCGALDSLERQSSQDSKQAIPFDKRTKLGLPLSFEDSEAHDSFDDPEVISKVSGSKAQGDSNKSQTTVFESIFGSRLPIEPSCFTSPVEQLDDTWTASSVQSSKFAHWFSEDSKLAEDLTSSRPNDLLSLIVGGDKGMCPPSDEKYVGQFPSENSLKSSEIASDLMSGLSSKSNNISNYQSEFRKTEIIPSVLTCEDLEQTMLSEFSDKNVNLPLTENSMQRSSVTDGKSEQLRPVDNHASQHLLSLLQKDTDLNVMQLRPDLEIGLNNVSPSDEWDMQAALGKTSEEGLKSDPGSITPTLEALFGSAFMRELQSADAPVSVQRSSTESAHTDVSEGLSFSLINDGSTHIVTNKVGQKSTSQRSNSLPLNYGQESRSESWLGISDSQEEPDSLKRLIGLNSRHNDILEVDRCQLREEEIMIANNDPFNHPDLMGRRAGPSLQGQLSSNAPINIIEKLTSIGAGAEKPSRIVRENSPFVHDPYNRIEPEVPHRNFYAQPSSSQFQNALMNQDRPLPFPSHSHPVRMNSHMKFMGLESMVHRDPSANHQLSANMAMPPFPHPSARASGVNAASHNQILQQMQMSGNHPPQLLHRFQNNVLPHPGNQPNTLLPEVNSMQGFPFGPHNLSSSGLPIPAPNMNHGSNHPEAFQRLLEMELRAKSKQNPPPGHNQAMYNNELDMGFRY